jgi:hypothetical protein
VAFSLRKLFVPRLDPSRPARAYRQYDVERGYAEIHATCRRIAPRAGLDEASPLLTDGLEDLRAMPEGDAAAIVERVTAEAALASLKKDSKNLEGYRVTDPARVAEILASALSPDVDARIAGFFESEYFVHWFTISRTPPGEENASVSFRWHCDRGPSAHLKLLVYLNPTEEHGGNTDFLALADTAVLAEKGYLFGPTIKRTGDLAALERLAGRPLHPIRRERRAGEAVLFQPSRVLHRGISPTRGARFVLTLCLLPSPLPWREALRRNAITDLAADEKWHDHAGEILRKLGDSLPGGGAVLPKAK